MADEFIKAGTRAIFAMTSMTEAATYYPGGDLGAGIAIRVIADREPIAGLEYAEMVGGTSLVIELANDATLGVTSVQEMLDKIDVALVEGQAAKRLLVNSVLQSDPGTFRVLATA